MRTPAPPSSTPWPKPSNVKESDRWVTPGWLTALLGRFDLDPASNPRSTVQARRSYQLERGEDGLTLPWRGSVYLNPPYSAPLPWCERLVRHDGPWCALLKLDPSTRWWATLMTDGVRWSALRRRVKFSLPDRRDATPPFCSALVYRDWSPSEELSAHLWPAAPGVVER